MTTLYAQSTGNWDAINWNTAANGSGSNQTPAAGDTLVSNSYTVTVNGNYTVTKVTNTSGGTFTLANGVTLTCTDGTAGVVGDYANVGAVTFALTGVGESATLISKVVGGNAAYKYGVHLTGTRTLTITGNITGGTYSGSSTANSPSGVYISGAGTLIVTGNVYGGVNNSYCDGISIYGAATLTVTGDVIGGGTSGSNGAAVSHGINIVIASSVITINGNVLAGYTTHGSKSVYGINASSASTITINGNCTAHSTGGTAINLTAAVAITITGIITAANDPAIQSTNASAVISISGEILPSTAANGVSFTTGIVKVSGPLRVASNGRQALYGALWLWKNGTTGLTFETYIDGAPAEKRTLYGADVHPDLPSPANVRYGTTYGPSNEVTGTCRVPTASSVAYGALVDDTTGTAVLTAEAVTAAVWDTLVADLDAADSIGARLAQAATVPSTGAQIAALGV